MQEVTVTTETEVVIGLYRLEDAQDTCIAGDVNYSLDGDNDIIITTNEYYFIDKNEYDLLEKAKELTQDDWDIISTQQLLTSE